MSEIMGTPSRRTFLGTAAAVGAVGAAGAVLAGCSGSGGPLSQHADYPYPPLLDTAPDGPPLKAGLIGCGGRGTGAAQQFLSAGPNLELIALADVFADRLEGCRNAVRENRGVEVPEENCFLGFDAYERLIDSGVDVVLIATPPYFRPLHFEAAVNARKHVFMEKPVAVDPVGARSIMTTARRADTLGLCVVTGTQRRHQRDYVATFRQVANGMIGEIAGANCYWNQNQLWYRTRQRGWSDMEWMIRDWVNWCWLSGDHIVEQHVHNLDVINWFAGSHPVQAVGFGGRHRRVTGDQYDFFSVDYIHADMMHEHSMCRQINGCVGNVSEFVMGTKGYTNCRNRIWDLNGELLWEYTYPLNDEGESTNNVAVNPYDQEHIDLVTAIRTGPPINEAENTAVSTMTAIMGRISAYTGRETTWDEMMNSDFTLGPDRIALGPVNLPVVVPVPGSE